MKTTDIGFGEFPEDFKADMNTAFIKDLIYIEQEPYVGEDGIYIPVNKYEPEGCTGAYKCVLTKELFVEAYNKWIRGDKDYGNKA